MKHVIKWEKHIADLEYTSRYFPCRKDPLSSQEEQILPSDSAVAPILWLISAPIQSSLPIGINTPSRDIRINDHFHSSVPAPISPDSSSPSLLPSLTIATSTPLTNPICCEVQGCGVLYTATGVARRLWRHSRGHSQAAVLQRYKIQINPLVTLDIHNQYNTHLPSHTINGDLSDVTLPESSLPISS
jgi:hypothetical protein